MIPNDASLPSFSIVMPCYNVERFVEEALVSCFRQNYPGPVQYVIVDDCSTDATWQRIQETVAREGAGRDIITVRHDVNRGVCGATDTAYSLATGDWLVKADSDDVQLPGRLSHYADIISRHPDVGYIVLSCQRTTEDGSPLEHVPYCACLYDDAPDEVCLRTPKERCANALGTGNSPCFYALGGLTAIKSNLYRQWGKLLTGEETERFSDDTVWEVRCRVAAVMVGSRALACLYRSRTSGNLEYRRQGCSFGDMKKEELLSARNLRARATAYHQCLKAIRTAATTPGMSDWLPEQLDAYAARIDAEATYFFARAEWWQHGLFYRLRWYLRERRRLIPPHRRWCLRRVLMPLWLVCLLKALRGR